MRDEAAKYQEKNMLSEQGQNKDRLAVAEIFAGMAKSADSLYRGPGGGNTLQILVLFPALN